MGRFCPNKRNGPSQDVRGGGQNPGWQPKPQHKKGPNRSGGGERKDNVNAIYYIDRPVHEVAVCRTHVGEHQLTVLCDTGAGVSIIRSKLGNKFLKDRVATLCENQDPKYQLHGAGGAEIKTDGVITVPVTLEPDVTIYHNFVMVPVLKYDMFWGTDFLHTHKAAIDFQSASVRFAGANVNIPLVSHEAELDSSKFLRLRWWRQTETPPSHPELNVLFQSVPL